MTIDHPDHSAPRVLASVGSIPYLKFQAGRFIVWRQPGNDGPGSITSYDPDTGDGIELAPASRGGRTWSLFSDSYVLASPTDGQAVLLPIAGGNPIPLVDADYYYGFFVGNNQSVFFNDQTMGVHRVDVGGGAPILLQPTANGFFASPDASFFLSNTMYSKTDNTYDLFLASGTAPGGATMLSSAVAPYLFGFTADSRYALYLENVVFTDKTLATGDLKAAPTAGGAIAMLAKDAIQFESVGQSRIVVADHSDGKTCDLELIDVAQGTVVPIASGVTVNWTSTFWQVPGFGALLYLRAEGLFLTKIP